MAIDTQVGSTSPRVEGRSSPEPAERLIAALVALALALGGVVFAIVTFRAGADLPSATVTQENGLIALATGDPARISVVNEDGTNARQVTTGKEQDPRAEDDGRFWWGADWSPDGRSIVSMRATPTGSEDPYDWVDNGVYVMRSDGSDVRLLGERLWGAPAWAPAPISSPSPTPRRAEVSRVALPDGLTASRIAIGEGAVWALASTGQTGSSVLVRIDPSMDQVVATASLAPRAWYLAAIPDAVWIGFPGSSVIQRVDAATNEMTGQIQLRGDGIGAIAADDRAVWVEVIQDRSDQGRQNLASLVRIDPQTSQVVATIPLEGLSGYDDEIAIGAGDVWVAGVNLTGPSEERGADLVRIDPITNTVSARLPVSAFSVRAGADVTWVTSPADGVNDSLHKPEEWVARSIDPLSSEISPPTPLPGNVSGVLGVTADGVWFSGYDAEGLIHPVRLQNDAFDASVPPIDAVYTDMALDGATGTIWIAATSALRRIDHG
jgi:hypothetical protein